MIVANQGLMTASALASAALSLPYIKNIRSGTTPYVVGDVRHTTAEIVFQDEGDARRASRQLMIDALDRIAEGETEGVEGWSFTRHDHRPVRFILPNVSEPHSNHNIVTEAVIALERIREGMTVQAESELPDKMVIRGPQGAAKNFVKPRHELIIQWFRTPDSREVRADITIASPLSAPEETSPFFTLESLLVYLSAAS